MKNQIRIEWKKKQSKFKGAIRHAVKHGLASSVGDFQPGYKQLVHRLDLIHGEVAGQLERMRAASDYADGRGRIEKQGYSMLPEGVKKYQFKFGFAHNVSSVVNDDLASENSPEWAAMKEQEKMIEREKEERKYFGTVWEK